MGKSLNVLAFGDSLTVGFGAPLGSGFVDLYKQMLQTSLEATIVLNNAGVNGATSHQLLQTLLVDPELQQQVKSADLIIMTVGGNDLIQAALPYFYKGDTQYLQTGLQAFEENYGTILSTIQTLKGTSSNYMRVLIGLYNPIPQVPEAAYWVQRFNRFLRKMEEPTLRFVNVYDIFVGKETELLFEDHIHPNALGYSFIAQRIKSVMRLKHVQHLLK